MGVLNHARKSLAGGSSAGQPDAMVAGCVIDVYIFCALSAKLCMHQYITEIFPGFLLSESPFASLRTGLKITFLNLKYKP